MRRDIRDSQQQALITQRGSMPEDAYVALVADGEAVGGSIAGEIDDKLGGIWKQLPYKVVGFFGEAQGYSSEVVDTFIQSALDEFDAVPNYFYCSSCWSVVPVSRLS